MTARPILAASCALLAASTAIGISAIASAAPVPISVRDSFRIGDSGVRCSAQSQPSDVRLSGLFDRAYALTCRDAASAVGSLIAVRRDVNLATEPSGIGAGALQCSGLENVMVENLGAVRSLKCVDPESKLDYRRYSVTRGDTTFFVEGLAGYDPALRIALASVVTDTPQVGSVRVATTEVSDSAAFARVQAGLLDSESARREAYVRNNGGQFGQAAEFFENLTVRENTDEQSIAEAIANQGLQQSNLSNFAAADRLFDIASARTAQGDGVMQRLLRNYRAINKLNQIDSEGALAELAKSVSPVAVDESEAIRTGLINIPLASVINRESSTYRQVTQSGGGLRPSERAAVLDAQALQLEGIALRQAGKYSEASLKMTEAARALGGVRNGELPAAAWLAADIAVERGLIAEAQGDRGAAGSAFDEAIALLEQSFAESPLLLAARARKASFLARSGQTAEARALFDQVVQESDAIADSGATLRELLRPYFDLLARDGSAAAAAQMFRAAQILERPGVAQTQAVLARQFSEGQDEASAMFRLAVVRARDVARTEAEIATLGAKAQPTSRDLENLEAAKSYLEELRREQTGLQAKLADYPRYKALSSPITALADLQAGLRGGEGYYKMMVVGNRIYGVFATNGSARAMRLSQTSGELSDMVTNIRNSIVRTEGGEQIVDVFDVDRARKLYVSLLGPVDSEVRGLNHFIFEPDGAMLQLPPHLLITSQSSIDNYLRRATAAGGDAYDLRGIDWLGKDRQISISVSPRGFLDMRALIPSTARQAYLGLGSNEPVATRPVAAVADECSWPVQTWQYPIAADELQVARDAFGASRSALMTGAAFTDTALMGSDRLDDYRVLHFATHGLVTAPRRDCPARPALVTSFGGPGSDGLLSFREIFDLQLNADLVILSACDTAGGATEAVSREAGVLTGGNYALDGLVRAFVGAGARSVVASHWPVPDDYDATKRLISGLVEARPGQSVAGALEEAQEGLMNDADTSHPFYWAAFIIVGDGAKPMVTARIADGQASASSQQAAAR